VCAARTTCCLPVCDKSEAPTTANEQCAQGANPSVLSTGEKVAPSAPEHIVPVECVLAKPIVNWIMERIGTMFEVGVPIDCCGMKHTEHPVL
jgi:hypothetical protein